MSRETFSSQLSGLKDKKIHWTYLNESSNVSNCSYLIFFSLSNYLVKNWAYNVSWGFIVKQTGIDLVFTSEQA